MIETFSCSYNIDGRLQYCLQVKRYCVSKVVVKEDCVHCITDTTICFGHKTFDRTANYLASRVTSKRTEKKNRRIGQKQELCVCQCYSLHVHKLQPISIEHKGVRETQNKCLFFARVQNSQFVAISLPIKIERKIIALPLYKAINCGLKYIYTYILALGLNGND